MAGIYIHIPFCKQACSYCNFHFSTSLKLKEPLLAALQSELKRRCAELDGRTIDSVYFGGGTPSLLTRNELMALWDVITDNYSVSTKAEITLEANPDDLSLPVLRALKASPVNRLSIGIQSFYDEDLHYMHRAHSASDARKALEDAMNTGWHNITIDLIYGTPTLSQDHWVANLDRVIRYGIPHLSAYQLTIEPKTILAAQIKKGIAAAPIEASVLTQFELLMQWSRRNNFEHYEISNLAKPGHRAVHNSNYWNRTDYLGIGPSAHSLSGRTRQWNVANNARYIKQMQHGLAIDASETLSGAEVYNETVMTGLRTSEGVQESIIRAIGIEYWEHFALCIQTFMDLGQVRKSGDRYFLTDEGKCLADRVASGCFWV